MKLVIAGAGEVGRHLAHQLSNRGHDIVLIEQRADALAVAEENLDVLVLEGDSAWRSVLRQAEVGASDGIIAVTGSDDANMLAAALGRQMGAPVAVARVDNPGFYDLPGGSERGVLGVDHLLCSTRLTCSELLTHVARAEAAFVHSFAAGTVQVAVLRVPMGHAPEGWSPRDLKLGRTVTLGAIVRDGFLRRREEIPRLEAGDQLVLAGNPEQLYASLVETQGHRKTERAVVVGGSGTGGLLARVLADRGLRVELVERDAERCRALANELEKVRVLRGDATDLSFLKDIRFDEAQSVFAVTLQEEVNLLTTMLVRQLERPPGTSAPHTYVAVHRPGYADLSRRIGIEGTASSFEVLSRAILEAITPPGLVCRVDLPDLAWALFHHRLGPRLIPDLTLADAPVPSGAVVLSVVRGSDHLLPRPSLRLEANDELVTVCPQRDQDALTRSLRGLAEPEARR